MMHLKRGAVLFLMTMSTMYLALTVYLNFSFYWMFTVQTSMVYSTRDLGNTSFRTIGKCKTEKSNFVFIKCMKCATETMGTILRRFGYTRNLNYVLPVKRNLYLGWPYPMEWNDFRQSRFEYNILMEHSIYTEDLMHAIMPNDTAFISMIRNPWSHFKSAYSYFAIGDISKVPNENVEVYLENITFYEGIYQSAENNVRRWCVPDGFSMTRNLQSHCLGMPLGFPASRADISKNETEIKQYLQHLESRFTLVLIVDYFQESLVLLKRTMCWSFKDILYHHSNVGNYKDVHLQTLKPSGRHYEIHRNWSHVDYMMYDHFNKTFWQKVEREGPSFYDEVDQFRIVQMLVERFCFIENMWKFPEAYITVPGSRFSDQFTLAGEDCVLMNTYMLPMLWAKFYEREGIPPEEFESIQKRPRPPKGCSIF